MPSLNLPTEALRLCRELNAPHRLIEHLRLVHCVAFHLLEAFEVHFPNIVIDKEAVLFGAATHDLGKVVHPEELSCPGERHAEVGPALLVEHGISVELARFAGHHSRCDSGSSLEEMLVGLADATAVGKRNDKLESLVVGRLVESTEMEPWEAFSVLDEILQSLSVQTTFARTGE
jgi:hypothetical protein